MCVSKIKHYSLITLANIFSLVGIFLLFSAIFNTFASPPFSFFDNLRIPLLNITDNWSIDLIFLPLFFASFFWFISIFIKDKLSPNKKISIFPPRNENKHVFLKINKFTILSFIVVLTLLSLLLYIDNSYFITEIWIFISMLIFIVSLAISMIDIKNPKFSTFDIFCIFIVPLIYMILHMFSLMDPRKIYWLDEEHFYYIVKDILENGIIQSFFDRNGAHGFHPFSASYFQALLMWPFGSSAFSFRMTSVLSIMFFMPPTYLIVKEISSKITGLIVLLLICFSHYMYNFAYLGYNNSFLGIFAFMWGLYFLILAKKNLSIGHTILSGLFFGICWYLYGVVILGTFATGFVMLCLSRKNFKKNLCIILAFYLTILIVIIPLTGISIEENINYISRHSNYTRENISLLDLTKERLQFGFIKPFTLGDSSHWLFGPAIDYITSFFMFIGIFLFTFKDHKKESQKIFLLFSFVLWLAIMLSTPYPHYSNTRIMYLVVFWLIFSAHGIYCFIKILSNKSSKIIISTIFTVAIIYFNCCYGLVFPFKYQYEIKPHGIIAQISLDNKNINNLYIVSSKDFSHYYSIFYQEYLIPSDLTSILTSDLSKLPNKLQENDAIVILEKENKNLINTLVEKLQDNDIKAIFRKNLKDRGEVFILAHSKMIQKIIDDASPDKMLVASLYLPPIKS